MIRASHSKKFSSLAGPAEHTHTVLMVRPGVLTGRSGDGGSPATMPSGGFKVSSATQQ